MNNKECCPKFNPAPWDEKTFEWTDKRFIRDKVATFFYMPLNFGSVMRRMNNKVEASGGKILDGLCLSEHISQWTINTYLAVDKEILGADNFRLSGKFISKVYEGNFKDMGNWITDFTSYISGQGLKTKKLYTWYTTCPKCAKKYGKNYVVMLASI